MINNIDEFYFDSNTEELSHIFDYRPIELRTNKVCNLDWYPSDTELNYRENLRSITTHTELPYKTLAYYNQNPITYRVNSDCFRDDNLESKPKEIDLYLGCSYTFGIGVHEKNSWPYKLSNYLKFPYINGALPGSGPLTHYRVLLYISKKFKIRNVYHYHDINHVRYEWFQDIKYPTYAEWTTSTQNHIPVDSSTFNILSQDRNISLMHHLVHNAIKGFCKERNINYYFLNSFANASYVVQGLKIREKLNFKPEENILARDLKHPSVLEHHIIFIYFLFYLRIKLD
jgi:hypothetical protein